MNLEKLPNILMLQRKSIRMFPDNVMVGLYYSKELGRYFTISNDAQAITEDREEQECSED